MSITPEEFGTSFKSFMDQMASRAPRPVGFFRARLGEHFGGDPRTLPIVTQGLRAHDRPNLHQSLERLVADPDRAAAVHGIAGQNRYQSHSLGDLATGSSRFQQEAAEGPVEYANVEVAEGRVLPCVRHALYLMHDAGVPLALLVREDESPVASHAIILQVMAQERAAAERLLHEIRRGMREHDVYRGRVVSLAIERGGELEVRFHPLPRVEREGIILPDGLLARIERLTIGFASRVDRLREAGLHARRGLLLYGPPGTGKTLTAMYLAGAMSGRTVLLMTGRGLGLVGPTCAMARALQPATVILEDVDLIAEERTSRSGCNAPLLFELLNEMDGLGSDADVLFLLTTNRADLLEPALASRPGRIDQSVEVPLPDAACRRRLLELYGRGLDLRLDGRERLVERLRGASAAFVRELVRRAALHAGDGGSRIVVTDAEMDEALHELVEQGGPLTRSLLGFRPSDAGPGETVGEP